MSTSESHVGTSLAEDQGVLLNYRRKEALALLDLPETFYHADLPDCLQNSYSKFKCNGIIEVAERNYGDPNVYRIPDIVRRYVEEHIEAPQTAPCGNTGVRNLGDEFTCSDDECGCRFDRETALEVIGGTGR